MVTPVHHTKLLKVLSVEDDEFMRIFLKDIFWLHGSEANIEFSMVEDLEHARKRIADSHARPDIIFLDLMLPERASGVLDKSAGFRLLKDIKANPKTKDIKVIVFSGYRDRVLQEEAERLGAERYLVKGEHLPQDVIRLVKSFTAARN